LVGGDFGQDVGAVGVGIDLSQTIDDFAEGEMRKVSRAANFMSPWVMRGTP